MRNTVSVPELFGSDVFNESTMKERLSANIYGAWKQCIENSSPLPLDVANEIADAMKSENGERFNVSKTPVNENKKPKNIQHGNTFVLR